MSTLADTFAAAPSIRSRARKGPQPSCEVYGPGDVALFTTLHDRRRDGESWAEVQQVLDGVLKIPRPIKPDHFRYHWSGKCGHWDGIDLP